MKALVVSAATLLVASTIGMGANAADLAAQLDVVAPLVNAEDMDAIGGPDDPAEIIAGLDGQWFTLNNVTRNWGSDGVGFDQENLARSVARNCSDEADPSITYEVTGDTSWTVREILPRYETELTQTVTHLEGRRFSISVNLDELLHSYGKGEASESERAEMQEMVAMFKEQGAEFWRPSDDIFIASGPFGIDVTGRCPST
ncbi:hypothetical protein [Pelagibacterium mangrovi]|uniref:hypothetical protein n=1 Tax=Pelagibacterium mangrovi TaxID=3119828 RepID=UPI002FC7608A